VFVAAGEVEVDARRRRDPGLVQPSPSQLHRVDADPGREVRHVGVHVERPVGGRDVVDPGRSEPSDQHRFVDPVPLDVGIEFVGGVERRQRCHLRHVRGADVQVLLQSLDGVDQRLRYDHPPDPPAGHRPVLREAVDHHGRRLVVEQAGCRAAVDDAVVDLVADDRDAPSGAGAGDLGQRVVAEHGARRVRR
jgi:hypothetical protein